MAQHFLLSAAARTLKLKDIYRLSDDEAFKAFAAIRFAENGAVEIDGAYFGGHVRQENRKEDRKDRRRAENRDADRRVVVVLRQRQGRTLPFVVRREGEGAAIAMRRVDLGSELHADEALALGRA